MKRGKRNRRAVCLPCGSFSSSCYRTAKPGFSDKRSMMSVYDQALEHFASVEGGDRVTPKQLLQTRRDAPIKLASRVGSENIPTLTQIEGACKTGRSPGEDLIKSELLKLANAECARMWYPVILKSFLLSESPLKGGTLIPLWKGKGSKGDLSQYRSVLLATSVAKSVQGVLSRRNSRRR